MRHTSKARAVVRAAVVDLLEPRRLLSVGLFKDLAPGNASGPPRRGARLNGVIYYDCRDEAHGDELWRTDGTAAGTFMVKDINPGSGGSLAQGFTTFNGYVYF